MSLSDLLTKIPPPVGGRRLGLPAVLLLLHLFTLACAAFPFQGETASAQAAVSFAPIEPTSSGFVDVAKTVGLDFQHGAFRWGLAGDPVAMMGGGLCWLDYDRDGWQDLFVVNSYTETEAGTWEKSGGLPRSALFHNVGGQFVDVSAGSGADLALRGNGCVAADFDLDGWPDLYITTARVNMLLWNNGDNTFSEGAATAGVDGYGWQTGAAVGDLNGDGWPDLFVAGYVDLNNRMPEATLGFPNTHRPRPDMLYLNQGPAATGRVTFREIGLEVGLRSKDGVDEYGLGALLSDLDADGDLDLYVANDTNPNRLYINTPWPGGAADDPKGIGFRLAELGGPAGVDDPNSGMGIAGGDYDDDGRLDLMITNLGRQLNAMFANQSGPDQLTFQDASRAIDLPGPGADWTGWGTAWADIDLDTDLDLFIVNSAVPIMDMTADAQPIQLFGNLTGQGHTGQFVDLTQGLGLYRVGPRLGRGSAVADYDNDGDLDLAVNAIGEPLALLQNNVAHGHWLEVQLDGFQPGALVTAVLPDGRELKREVHAGSSYLSSEDPRCHFGLGTAAEVRELRVRWPDGQETRLEKVAANQLVLVQK